MAGERALPGLGLTGDWNLGSSGWKPGMDMNLLTLSVAAQLTVKGRVNIVPASPDEGDIYLVLAGGNANRIAVRDEGAWVYLTPQIGWQAYDAETDEHLIFKGEEWEVLVIEGGGGGGGGGGTTVNNILIGTVISEYPREFRSGSSSPYATKGNTMRAVASSRIGAVLMHVIPAAAGETYKVVVARMVGQTTEVEAILAESAEWVSTAAGERSVIMGLNQFAEIVAGLDYSVLIVRTDGDAETPSRPPYPSSAPARQLIGFEHVRGVREAVLPVVEGSNFSDFTTAGTHVEMGLYLALLDFGDLPSNGEAITWHGGRIQLSGNVTTTGEWVRLLGIDDDPMVDTDEFTNPSDRSAVRVPAGVTRVRVTAGVRGQDAIHQANQIALFKNGSGLPVSELAYGTMSSSFTNNGVALVSPVLEVEEGDYFDLRMWTSGTTGYRGWLQIEAVEGELLGLVGGGGGLGDGTIEFDILGFMQGTGTPGNTTSATKGNRLVPYTDLTVRRVDFGISGADAVANAEYKVIIARLQGVTVEEIWSSEVVTDPSGSSNERTISCEFETPVVMEEGLTYFVAAVRTNGADTDRVAVRTATNSSNLPADFALIGGHIAKANPVIGDTFSAYTSAWHDIRIYAFYKVPVTGSGGGGGGGGIGEAPADGKQYARQNNGWSEVEAGSGDVEEAPEDDQIYGRVNKGWFPIGDFEGLPVSPYHGARIRPSADQVYTVTGAYAPVRFDTVDRDTGGFTNPEAPNRLYVPAGVTKVRVAASLKANSPSSGAFPSNTFLFAKNGQTQNTLGAGNTALTPGRYTNPGVTMTSDVIDVEEGDYFEVIYFTNASFTLNADRMLTWFAMEVVERGLSRMGMNAKMGDLLDADLADPEDGDVAIWNEAEQKWMPGKPTVLVNEAASYARPFSGAMAHINANKALGTPLLPFPWDATDYDTDGYWSAASPGRFTVPEGVTKVRLHVALSPGSGSWGTNENTSLEIYKNGSPFRGGGQVGWRTGYNDTGLTTSTPVVPCEEGDYFEVRFNRSSTGNVTWQASRCSFSIEAVEFETEIVP